jgi:hypothetical protein
MLYRAIALVALALTACGDKESPFPETVYIEGGPQVIDFPVGGDECWQEASTRPVAHLLAPPNGITLMACHSEGGVEYCAPQIDWWVFAAEGGGYDVFWTCGQGGLAKSMETDGHLLVSYW